MTCAIPVAAKRLALWLSLIALAFVAGCEEEQGKGKDATKPPVATATARYGLVTVSGDDALDAALNWRAPELQLEEGDIGDARRRAESARNQGRLYQDADSAIPLQLAILRLRPEDDDARAALKRSVTDLVAEGGEYLQTADDDADALQRAHVVAAVARTVAPGEPAVARYLSELDLTDRLWELNAGAEEDIRARRFGAQGGGALRKLREALRLRPGQPRAMQGKAAVESGLIRNAEIAADEGQFSAAERWLELAARVRGGPTITDAKTRLEAERARRIAGLRSEGLKVLPTYNGVRKARDILADILLIAPPGNKDAADLRRRIDLAQHYGSFRPRQAFTDALRDGGRGPQMVVVPHGAFRMGAGEAEPGAQEYEQPARYVRFDRGFAMSVTEVTVGEFRRYLSATGARTRAARRGYSMPYDERGGNFVRRSLVDARSDYLGRPAGDDLPVLHVSAGDADDYVTWLSEQTGHNYRLPSEAEFEYALRAGGTGVYPWGARATPAAGAGNFTGSRDQSPAGRRWTKAVPGYGDGHWGPAPVGSFRANAFGLRDLSGNVVEWVADCWHDSYRRAPDGGAAWVNPGCRTRVIRGGSWASAPEQLRSAWRAPVEKDTTNAQIGFRVVRDL